MPVGKPRNVTAPAQHRTEGAFRALIRTCGLIHRVMQPYFLRFGISGSQWGVLRALHRAESEGLTGLRLTDLGTRLLVRPPSVTGTVDRLQRLGLVSRTAAADDLRAKHVSLTPAGRQLVQRVLQDHGSRTQAVLSGLSAAQQEELHRLLDRLCLHLEAMAEQEDGPTVE